MKLIGDMEGRLYFDNDGTIVGYLKIGNEHYQISGVRANPIRADIKATSTSGAQEDLFDAREGQAERDLA
jgi:hypothetical protein